MGHKGHMMLASSVITQASKAGGDPYFVVSKTVGKDDPITPDEKIAIYKKVFPQSGHIFQPATDEIPDLTRVLQNLNQQGYTSVTVVLGADQVKAFQYLKNYNNKPDKSGNILYSFDNLDVISRQETGDPSAGEEGPRATPMRQVLMDPTKSEQEQFAVWRDAMSPEIGDDEVRDLMMKAKERMTAMNAPKPKKAKAVVEAESKAMSNAASRLANKDDGKVAKLRAAGDKRRDSQYMSSQIAKNDRTSKDEWGDLKQECAGVGVIASKKQAKDPRYSMSLTRDVRPGQVAKNMKAFSLEEGEAEYGAAWDEKVKRLGQMAKEGPRKTVWDPVKRVYKTVPVNPPKDQPAKEAMLPKSAFAGSDKNKLGPAAHAKGKQKGPVKQGQFVGGMEEAKKKGADGKACWDGYRYNGTKNGKDSCVKVSEGVEDIMDNLINKIIMNEAISNNRR